MKHTTAILTVLLLAQLMFAVSACTTHAPNGQATELSDNNTISIPEFFNDLGKTLNTLRNEHPGAATFIEPGGFPDAAAACFGEPEGEYTYLLFGGHDGDFEEVMDGYGNQLKCAGFLTTAGVLFPGMGEDMMFSDFFRWIGVSDYTYHTGSGPIEGWLEFKYNNMDVWLNANEDTTGGEFDFSAVDRIKSSFSLVSTDEEILWQNGDLAHAVMFD